MKFICVDCDDDLIVKNVDTRENGSVWLHLQCRLCGWQMALIASNREAEMLRNLGIRFSEQGRTVYMELVKAASADEETDPDGDDRSSETRPEVARGPELVLRWTPRAEEVVASLPDALRPLIVAGIERFARQEGYRRIDEGVLEEMKNRFRL
jgi:hypothetical protein